MTEQTKKEMNDLIASDSLALSSAMPGSEDEANILKGIAAAQQILSEQSKIDNLEVSNTLKARELDLKLEEIRLENKKLEQTSKQMELEEKRIKSQSRKDMVIAFTTAGVKLLGVAACVVTAGAFVGASMQAEYQMQMVKPKSLGDGLKFIMSLGTKLI